MFWVILIAAILFLNIELRIYSITRKRSFYVLKLCIAGIKVYRAAFFIKKEKKDGVLYAAYRVKKRGYKKIADISAFLRKNDDMPPLRGMLNFFCVKKANINIIIGLKDAACAALLCGAINVTAGAAKSAFGLKNVCVTAACDFKKTGFMLYADCIIKTCIAQIITGFIKLKGGNKNAPDRKYIKDDNGRA